MPIELLQEKVKAIPDNIDSCNDEIAEMFGVNKSTFWKSKN